MMTDMEDTLRSRLQSAFENISAGIVLTTRDFEFLGKPKEFRTEMKVVWTAQMEELYRELIREGVVEPVFGLIMSGPSGIGKSCIGHTIANRLFAEGRTVLYIPDMQLFLGKAKQAAVKLVAAQKYPQVPMDMLLGHCVALQLREHLLRQNDSFKADEVLVTDFLTASDVMDFFNENKVFLVVDQHGHGFKYLKDNNHCVEEVCGFLLPNSYLRHGNVRFLFCGSNQAVFELALNETYRELLRFILPFTNPEAARFVADVLEDKKYTAEQHKIFANNVPRQMILLSKSATTQAYLATQHLSMYNDLTTKLANELDNQDLLNTLSGLFKLSSNGYAVPVSFLDLGFVYRKLHETNGLLAHPLCYSASLALLDLWKNLSSKQGRFQGRLEQVQDDGTAFEEYLWEVFLSRAFGPTPLLLKGRRVGHDENEPMQLISFNANACVVSEVQNPNGSGAELFQSEVASLAKRAQAHQQSILYKCPEGSDTVDFILFRATGLQSVVQSSISEFANHPAPDLEFLGRGRKKKSLRLNIDYFFYATVKPNPHPHPIIAQIAKDANSKWFGCHEVVRIVDASENFGF